MKGSNGKKGLRKGERHVKTCSKGRLPIPIKGVAKEDATSRAAESIAADSDSIATRAHSIANALEGTDLWTLGLLSVRVVTT